MVLHSPRQVPGAGAAGKQACGVPSRSRQSVISSKLLGDTALCSGKPEDITNSRLAALARDLDYFYHTTRRRHPRTPAPSSFSLRVLCEVAVYPQ